MKTTLLALRSGRDPDEQLLSAKRAELEGLQSQLRESHLKILTYKDKLDRLLELAALVGLDSRRHLRELRRP